MDKSDTSGEIKALRERIESETTTIEDLHLWQLSENERSLILSRNTSEDKCPTFYHDCVRQVGNYEHITVEIHKTKTGKKEAQDR